MFCFEVHPHAKRHQADDARTLYLISVVIDVVPPIRCDTCQPCVTRHTGGDLALAY